VAIRITATYPAVDFDYPHSALRIHFFAGEPLDGRGELPGRFRWVKRSELSSYDFPPANDQVLRMLTAQQSA
jgi:hypothetical protein